MKPYKAVAVFLLSLVAIAPFIFFFSITNFAAIGSELSIDRERSLISFTDEEVRILQLSDVQTRTLFECYQSYPTAKRVIRATRPDLIVLTGDNIADHCTELVLTTFIRFMDSFEIPWALVFGNHDYKTAMTPEQISNAYEASEYCIFKTGSMEGRYGNYYYNLEKDGEIFYTLFFMDSARSNFTEEQVGWYEESVKKISEELGRTIPSLVFFHIPIEETIAAHEQYQKDPTTGAGIQVEEVDIQDKNTGFFDAVKRLGSTKALFYGHDHRNNTHILYEGVWFCYATKTGYSWYYESGSVGGNLITIHEDESFGVERVLDWQK